MHESEAGAEKPARPWPDWLVALTLVLCAAMLHLWMVSRSAVMARDAIGFVRTALLFEEKPWSTVVQGSYQHPGYPAFLLAVSWPIRQVLGTTPDSMTLSAQLASSLAAALLAIPLYYLAREFFGRREAFAITLLFQVLPISLQSTSDGLSEGLYLLMALASLCLTAQGLRTRSACDFGLAGLCGGLAYLTRPEGAIVVLTAGIMLLAVLTVRSWRWSWQQVSICLVCLSTGALAGGSPYWLVTGRFTQKPTAEVMFGNEHPGGPKLDGEVNGKEEGEEPGPLSGFTGMPTLGCIWAAWWTTPISKSQPDVLWCLESVFSEIIRTLQYVLCLPLLIGLCCCRPWLRLPQAWLLLLTGLINTVILFWLAKSMGYVSERHTLLIAALCLFPVALGMVKLLDLLRKWSKWQLLQPERVTLLTWLALAGVLLSSSLRPLHANRTGHRAVGHWLAEHAQPYDTIVDPFAWAHYFAGHTLLEGHKPEPPPGVKKTWYIVLEQSDNPHRRLRLLARAQRWAALGASVHRWEPTGYLEKRAETVEVFAVPESQIPSKVLDQLDSD